MDLKFVSGIFIVLIIDTMLFFAQNVVSDINPDSKPTFLNNNLISEQNGVATGTGYVLNTSNIQNKFVSANSGVNVDTGNIFTDTYNAFRNWIFEKTGIGYVLGFLGAPYYFTKAIGTPDWFSFGIGAFWFILNLILLILLAVGR